jgi:hypothetical protein
MRALTASSTRVPTRSQYVARKRVNRTRPKSKLPETSPLVRKAIELMVWEGHRRDDAAKAVGLLPKSLYNALRKHHVKRYYVEQLDVRAQDAKWSFCLTTGTLCPRIRRDP